MAMNATPKPNSNPFSRSIFFIVLVTFLTQGIFIHAIIKNAIRAMCEHSTNVDNNFEYKNTFIILL